jgi:hypothetical protein
MDSFTSHSSSLDPPPVLTAVLDGPSDSPSPATPSIDVAPDVPMQGPSLRRAIHSWSHPSHHQDREKDKDTDLESIDKNSILESSHNSSTHKLTSNHVWSHLLYFHSHSKSRDTSKHLEPPSSLSNPKNISSALESTIRDSPIEPAVRGPSLESTFRGPSLKSKDGNAVPESVTKGPIHDLVTQEPVLASPSTHSLPQFLYFQSHSRSPNKSPKKKNPEVESLSSHSNWLHLLYFQSHSRSSLQDKRSVLESSSKVKHSINRLSLNIFKASKDEERIYYEKRVVDMFEWAETEVVDLKGFVSTFPKNNRY